MFSGLKAKSTNRMRWILGYSSQIVVFNRKLERPLFAIHDDDRNLAIRIEKGARLKFIQSGNTDHTLGSGSDKAGNLADIIIGTMVIQSPLGIVRH